MTTGQLNPDPDVSRTAGADDERTHHMSTTYDTPSRVAGSTRVSPLLAGVGLGILFLGFISMEMTGAGFSIDENLTVDQMLAQLDKVRPTVLLGGGIQAIVAMGVVVFGAYVRRALRSREPQGSLTPTIAIGGSLLAGSLLTVAAATTQLSGAFEAAVDPAILLTIFTFSENLFAGGWCALALTAGSVAVAGLARGSVPRWLAGVSAFIAVLLLVAQLAVPWAGWFPALLWIAVTSFSLRSNRESGAAVTA